MTRLFGHGDLRLYLLKLLEEGPRHGYDIITELENRFLGLYSPSPGTVYPRLAALEEEGLVEATVEAGGRKVYRLTDAGAAELEERSEELRELGRRVAGSARELAREVREDVRSSVRDLRREIKDAARDVRRDERRASRESRETAREARRGSRRVSDEARETVRSVRDAVREDPPRSLNVTLRVSRAGSLEADLESFVSDVLAAARRHDLDRERLVAVQRALREARALVLEALEGGGGTPDDD